MTALDLFEEYRFVLELLCAELLYLVPFARFRHGGFWRKTAGFAVMLLLPFGYRFVLALNAALILPRWMVFGGWYTLIMLASLPLMYFCFSIRWSDLLFIAISAYATQHIAYVLVNECLARGVWSELTEQLPLYALLCVLDCLLVYGILWFFIARTLRNIQGPLLSNTVDQISLHVVLLLLLIDLSFTFQHIFENITETPIYLSAVTDVICCVLILAFQYNLLYFRCVHEEEQRMEHLMEERRAQYEMGRETVELLNRKCHDMKHQLAALRQCGSEEQQHYLQELDAAISDYAAYANTGSEALNTLLTEKNLICANKGIELTAIADGRAVAFVSITDLYAIIGNALDNAIECVEQYDDPALRMISLHVAARQSFAVIEVTNCFTGTLTLRDGLPVTHKSDTRYHGIGLRSVRAVAAHYGGTLQISAEDELFTLRVVLPMPEP